MSPIRRTGVLSSLGHTVHSFAIALFGLGWCTATAGAQTSGPALDSGAVPFASAPTVKPGALMSRLGAQLNLLRTTQGEQAPPFTSFKTGNVVVPSGSSNMGAVGVSHGTLDVSGRVVGNAVAVDGDIHVLPGGEITGDAVAVGGQVLLDGGTVDGQILTLSDVSPAATAATTSGFGDTWLAVKLVITWFAVLLIIGIGVMIFADGTLDGVVVGLERGVGRAFWVGVLAQLLMLPALLVLVVGLAVTLIGILLIPFAVVAYVIAIAGLVTLGFLAIARLSGTLLSHDNGAPSLRVMDLRALIFGLAGYMVVWLVAAAFTWSPTLGFVLRALAIAITWVAATAGFGATILSRAGTRRGNTVGWQTQGGAEQLAWQTPTPISGVTRRPATPTRSTL